jgi:hypothetical protein
MNPPRDATEARCRRGEKRRESGILFMKARK